MCPWLAPCYVNIELLHPKVPTRADSSVAVETEPTRTEFSPTEEATLHSAYPEEEGAEEEVEEEEVEEEVEEVIEEVEEEVEVEEVI